MCCTVPLVQHCTECTPSWSAEDRPHYIRVLRSGTAYQDHSLHHITLNAIRSAAAEGRNSMFRAGTTLLYHISRHAALKRGSPARKPWETPEYLLFMLSRHHETCIPNSLPQQEPPFKRRKLKTLGFCNNLGNLFIGILYLRDPWWDTTGEMQGNTICGDSLPSCTNNKSTVLLLQNAWVGARFLF